MSDIERYPVWVCRREDCPHDGTPGMAICSDSGHQVRETYVPEAAYQGAVEELARARALACTCVKHTDHLDVDPACPTHGPRFRELYPERAAAALTARQALDRHRGR